MKAFANGLKLVFAVVSNLFNFNYEINVVNTNFQHLTTELKKFESEFTYPFSNSEHFKIEHGNNGDYSSFFKHLGRPIYFVVKCNKNKIVNKIINGKSIEVTRHKGEIAAVACIVLRTFKANDGKAKSAWYVCDLKVNEKYQGEHIPLLIMQKVGIKYFCECPRGYGICMNPIKGEPKAASIFKKHGPIKGLNVQTLNIYTLNYKKIIRYQNKIEEIFKKYGYIQNGQQLGFVSTSGFKDYKIINNSTGLTRAWNLLHIKPDHKISHPRKSAEHMLCAIESTNFDNDLKKILGKPSSTAQVVSYGMQDIDFNCLTTNQI